MKNKQLYFFFFMATLSYFLLFIRVDTPTSMQSAIDAHHKLSPQLLEQINTASTTETINISIRTKDWKTRLMNPSTFPLSSLVQNHPFFKTPFSDEFSANFSANSSPFIAHYQALHQAIDRRIPILRNSLYESLYAPFQFLSASSNEIRILAQHPDILSIDIVDNVIGDVSYEVSLETSGIQKNQELYQLNGKGIKIGLIEYEGYPDPTSFSELKHTPIYYDYHFGLKKILPLTSKSRSDRNHASVIASILSGKNGVLPESSIYAASVTNGFSFYQKTEWLIRQNVDVINFSGYVNSFNNGSYAHTAQWIDHLVHNQYMPFVIAAGNTDNKVIPSSSTAYNAIVVGAMNTQNTRTPNDDTFSSFSAYKEMKGSAQKPDITAPGKFIVNENETVQGTSISTPIVTGAVGQMLQIEHRLKQHPEVMKAILLASAFRKTASDYGTDPNIPDWSNKEGAGVLDARDAIGWIVKQNRFAGIHMNFSKNYERNIAVNKGEFIRIALTWNKEVKGRMQYNTPTPIVPPLNNLDLYVYDSKGNLLATSTSTNNNVELVSYRSPAKDIHRIVIKPSKSTVSKGWIGLAWW